MQASELQQYIAVTLIPGIGHIHARNLISYCGGPENVFRVNRKDMLRVPGIGDIIAGWVIEHREDAMRAAEAELKKMEDLDIRAVVFSEEHYPPKLKNCEDAPLVLYVRGEADFRNRRVLGIVGTRKATPYGRLLCEKLVDGLSHLRPLIVSGLALGIDGYAHREALKNGLETAAVLAHGLDRVYPSAHSGLAARIEKQGCVISDYVTGTKPDRENFPSRNRIIAGLCDAVVVVEAAASGGALITADLAASYNRDVFAFPGRVGDLYSAGCNRYIRENRAALIESAADIIAMMNWDDAPKKSKPVQKELFAELPPDEDTLYKLIALSNEMSVDDICAALPMTPSRIASALLGLELKGHLQALPGKVYRAV